MDRSDGILTNRIASMDFDFLALERLYGAFRVVIEEDSYARAINKIRALFNPDACVVESKGLCYFLKKTGEKFGSGPIKVSAVRLGDLPKNVLARLLIRAMARQKAILREDPDLVEADGLYYWVRSDEFYSHPYHVAIEIDLVQGSESVLKAQVRTFTDIQMHALPNGEIPEKLLHWPTFEFDEWSAAPLRKPGGRFIKKGLPGDSKNLVDVVDIRKNDYSMFRRSKAGIYYRFFHDIEAFFAGSFRIHLDREASTFVSVLRERTIGDFYKKLMGHLNEESISILNIDLDEESLTAIEKEIEIAGVRVSRLLNLVPDQPTLIVCHAAAFYQKKNLVDPYIKASDRIAPVQFITWEGVYTVKKGLSADAINVALKELAIKIECFRKRLKNPHFKEGRYSFALLQVITSEKKQKLEIYHLMTLEKDEIRYHRLDREAFLDFADLHLDVTFGAGDHLIFDYENKHYYRILETGVSALPEFELIGEILSSLRQAGDYCIPRSALEEYRKLLEGNISRVSDGDRRIAKELDYVLGQNPGENLRLADLRGEIDGKKFAFSLKGDAKKAFFAYLEQKRGIRLKASLRSADDGLFDSFLDIHYNEDERRYFVGVKGPAHAQYARASSIRKIESNAPAIASWFFDLLAVPIVRYREGSVYPVYFKHLREFIDLNGPRQDIVD